MHCLDDDDDDDDDDVPLFIHPSIIMNTPL